MWGYIAKNSNIRFLPDLINILHSNVFGRLSKEYRVLKDKEILCTYSLKWWVICRSNWTDRVLFVLKKLIAFHAEINASKKKREKSSFSCRISLSMVSFFAHSYVTSRRYLIELPYIFLSCNCRTRQTQRHPKRYWLIDLIRERGRSLIWKKNLQHPASASSLVIHTLTFKNRVKTSFHNHSNPAF